ncbi:HlyD family efflux transporter periplasmic adaptor subunit [Capilliphycus salinus ALCB114379]|uniref:HlyD family efflux transporter periplasmic adaptor subunit n=1 Tax=Capilliphycus salinus TaxID=2768948 RepID=UPI0039A6BB4D
MSFNILPRFRSKQTAESDSQNGNKQDYIYDLNFSQEEIEEAHSIRGGVTGSLPLTPPVSNSGYSFTPKDKDTEKTVSDSGSWSTALQSVLDQPPASFPMRVFTGGAVFFMAFATWAHFGTVEEIGYAQGELIPQGNVFKVHPVEMGKIATLAVKEGDAVKTGQVIAELDSQMAVAEIERLQQQLNSLQIEQTQKQGLLERTRLEKQSRTAIAQAQIQTHEAEIERVKTQIRGSERILNQLKLQAESAQARLENIEPLPTQADELLEKLYADKAASVERVERLKPLVEEGAISQELLFQAEQSLRDRERAIVHAQLSEKNSTKEQVFQAEQMLRDRQQMIAQNEGELQQLQAEVNRLYVELEQKQSETEAVEIEADQKIQQIELEIIRLQAAFKETQSLLIAAKMQREERFIFAPVDGYISTLNVSNTGEVVQPGQNIAEILPENTPLVLSASMPSKDAGFIKVGMSVNVKFDAYPYQDYGIIEGTVSSISPDTKIEPNQPPVYQLEIELEQNYVLENQEEVAFKPGQTATADIIIRQRRIADVILEPFQKFKKDGIKL